MRVPTNFITGLALSALLAGCGGDDQEAATETAGPTVSISVADAESVSPGSTLSVSVDVNGFELDAGAIGGDNVAGKGHYHLYWDDAGRAKPAAVSASPQAEVEVPADAVDGKHRLIASLRNNDHSPLDPPVQAGTTVTVSGGAARPTVSWKADNTTALQEGDTITLQIEVTNFTLDVSRAGSDNEVGVGHYRVYWDDAAGDDSLVMGAAPTVQIQVPADATDGSHKITVSLRNNDDSELSPPVQAEDWVLVYRLD